MNVKRIACSVCGNSSFHIFKIDDNGICSQNEHVCTKCGTHYDVVEVSQEYSALWNEFIAQLDTVDVIKSFSGDI